MSPSAMARKEEEAVRAEARAGVHLTSPPTENTVIASFLMGREERSAAGELLCLRPPKNNSQECWASRITQTTLNEQGGRSPSQPPAIHLKDGPVTAASLWGRDHCRVQGTV